MTRNVEAHGVVVSVKPLGERDSAASFITKEFGAVRATLYGGPKSRLRPLVSKWNSGVVWLYRKDEGDMETGVKVVDFDVNSYHLSFRENLYKSFAASLAAELALKTKCAGSPEQCWTLLSAFLDGLEAEDSARCESALIRFLWRYIALLGSRPDETRCAVCGGSFDYEISGSGDILYNDRENGFVCADCAARFCEPRSFPLSVRAGDLRYLRSVSEMRPAESRAISVSRETAGALKRLLFFLAEQAAGCRLKSIDTGIGIL